MELIVFVKSESSVCCVRIIQIFESFSCGNEILVSLITLIRKEIKRYLRIWVQTLVPPAVTMSLYFVIFGSLIGPRIGTMDGLDYIQFMIPPKLQ